MSISFSIYLVLYVVVVVVVVVLSKKIPPTDKIQYDRGGEIDGGRWW